MSEQGTARIESLEPIILLSASATDIAGTDGADWLSGTDGDDNIFAGGGNDQIYAPIGENFIDGGEGQDTLVIYEGARADYTVVKAADGTVTVEGPGANGATVKNTLTSVESINFTDGIVNVVDLDGDVAGDGDNVDPVAEDDQFSTRKNETIWGNVLVNDDDANGDPLTVVLKSGPKNGTLNLTDDGGFDYIPNSGFEGHDSFQYTVHDGNGGSDHANVSIWVNADDGDDDNDDGDHDKDNDGGKTTKHSFLKNLIWKKFSLIKKVKEGKNSILKDLLLKKKDVVSKTKDKKSSSIKDLFSNKKDLFAKKKDLFGKKKDLFGKKKDLFSKKKDLFSKKKDLFSKKKDLFSKKKDLFSKKKDLFSKKKDLSGKKKDLFGKKKDLFGKKKDLFGKKKDLFGKKKDLFGKKTSLLGKLFGRKSSGRTWW